MEKRLMANFAQIKQKYKENPIAVLQQLVGQGKIEGSDYVALNPRRNDSKLGSFRIDIQTGRFHDFATNDKGGSIIDLAMFVCNCGIVKAAQHLESLFPFLACQPLAVQEILAKKKVVDIRYIWKKSTIAEHEYLKNKKISLGNALVNNYKGRSYLVIPLIDSIPSNQSEFTIKALQFIDEDGNKRFSGSFRGMFHIASDFDAGSPCGQYSEKSSDTKVCRKITIILAEGYATARSIAESTDLFVIAAMSSCNLKNVVEKISEQFPNSRIVIAADNDDAGRNAAQRVSDIPNTRIVYPTQGFKDFNDMYQAVGAEKVRRVFCINGGVR